MLRLSTTLTTALMLTLLAGCDSTLEIEAGANAQGHTVASLSTIKINQRFLEKRPFENTQDFIDAKRGLIAQEPSLIIEHKQANEETVWNMDQYNFVDQDGLNAPGSVNPSLWRQIALNNIHGLFKVTDGVFQIRGYDLANMSIIETDNGWVIVDPLTSEETASRALLFAQKHLGKKPIKAILFTHSHIDHFGGIDGILKHLNESEREQVNIIAPKGFMEEATSENIIAGVAMSRRAMYMYGKRLARNERGHVGTGLGKGPAFGTFSLIEPTTIIDFKNTNHVIDGLDIKFQFVPESEAPAEFTFYIPKYKAFGGAELASRTMHNLYTLRGAKVRNAKVWSAYIEEARNLFSDSTVFFGSHHWPMWGQENIQQFLTEQRDTYKFIHDQSVRLLNQGLTPNEIADSLELPAELNNSFHNQGYYGTIKHNAKAIYQAYMGWFTGNPAKLDPLPEAQAATRYVEMMGGVDTIVAKAQNQFEQAKTESADDAKKTYRWLAEMLNHGVYAEPEHKAAKALLAKVYDQLGYQAESAPWRDFYLTGAYELRHGGPDKGINPAIMKNVLAKTPVQNFFESMAVRLKGDKASGEKLAIKISFSDLDEHYLLNINNAVMHHEKVEKNMPADATLTLTHPLFIDLLIGRANLKNTLLGDDLSVDGSTLDLINFFSLLDLPKGTFSIVTP